MTMDPIIGFVFFKNSNISALAILESIFDQMGKLLTNII